MARIDHYWEEEDKTMKDVEISSHLVETILVACFSSAIWFVIGFVLGGRF